MKCSHISESKFREILKYFCLDLTGSKICELTSLNKNTVSRILLLIRSRILQISKKENDLFNGQIEVDESDFGAKRVKGKRGRGALGKTIVFGLLKRGGKVYTEIVPDSSSATLQDVIRGKVDIDTVIHSDGWRGYNGLVDYGYKKHLRVDHRANEFLRGKSHINGIESFWGYAKTRLSKFRGIDKKMFNLHLK